MDYTTAEQTVHTPAWIAQAWIAFGVSLGGTVMGIYYLDVDAWPRAFLAIGLLMTVSSSFTLAKTLRDVHEAGVLVRRVDEARVEKLLTERNRIDPPPPQPPTQPR